MAGVYYTLEIEKEGSITADGTEQTVWETTTVNVYSGYVDLSGMQAGDTVVIRLYKVIQSGGAYRKIDEITLSGEQETPIFPLMELINFYGVKLTLQQTAGTYRTFRYLILRRVGVG